MFSIDAFLSYREIRSEIRSVRHIADFKPYIWHLLLRRVEQAALQTPRDVLLLLVFGGLQFC